MNKYNAGKNYTTILHGPRVSLGLSCNEYCIADMIFHLSRETGWCYASKETLARFIGMTKPSVLEIIRRLISKGLVEIHESDRRLLRTTDRWMQEVVIFKQSLSGKENNRAVRRDEKVGKEAMSNGGKATAPNNYNSTNTTKSGFSDTEKHISHLREKRIELSVNEIRHFDQWTLRIIEFFSDECVKNLNNRPIIKSAEYFATQKARQYLTEEEIPDYLVDWLVLDSVKWQNKPHLTKAFEHRNITTWKTTGGF